MTKTLEIGVGHLLPELPADALIFLGPLQAAGAVAAGALQALPDHVHHFLVIIQPYSHTITSSLPYFSVKTEIVKGGHRKTACRMAGRFDHAGTKTPWRTKRASLNS